jgi:hypothetical protein
LERRLAQGMGILLLLGGAVLTAWAVLSAAGFQAEPQIVVQLPTPATLPTPLSPSTRTAPEAGVQPSLGAATPPPAPSAQPPFGTRTREPLVPTALPVAATARTTPAGATPAAAHVKPGPEDRRRFGVGVPYPPLTSELADRLGIGWYLTWGVVTQPPHLAGVEFAQMVRLSESGYRPDAAPIQAAARANPGSTWLIGNEPDVIWQDNVTPQAYARHYYELYRLLKEADPTCQVAIGGVSQPTPLRMAYLDQVLAEYQSLYQEPMAVDVWSVHNFILREERDSWGVSIPPGLAAGQGQLFEIEDGDSLTIFRQQIVDFRRWMKSHGEQNKPLIVSEYGIPMPAEYGFGAQRMTDFMLGTFDIMLTTADPELGYPADDYRLVQRWTWFSLADDTYPTGNLINRTDGSLTDLGQAYAGYVSERFDCPQNLRAIYGLFH